MPINFRTAQCSFRIGPIMIVDEPFTVSFHSYLYSRSYHACELDIIFYSDRQRTDDTHHENKTGQSDCKIPNRDRSVVQVRYGVLVRVSADSSCNKKIYRERCVHLIETMLLHLIINKYTNRCIVHANVPTFQQSNM